MGIRKWVKSLSKRDPLWVLHDSLMVGDKSTKDLTNDELLNLHRFTRWYHPSFEVFTMTGREMEQRRGKEQ